MGIRLTEPFSFQPGHNAPVEVLAEIKITSFSVDIVGKVLTINTDYGNTVDGVWVQGNANGHTHRVENKPEQINYADPANSIPADPVYDILMGTTVTPAAGVPVYGVVGLSLYTILISEGLYAGEIEL